MAHPGVLHNFGVVTRTAHTTSVYVFDSMRDIAVAVCDNIYNYIYVIWICLKYVTHILLSHCIHTATEQTPHFFRMEPCHIYIDIDI